MATQDFEDWNGEQLPYVPADVTIPDTVELHEDYEKEVDPVSYEVVRHSLWNINREHGNTIENLSVSPITLETRDFQTGLLTENAEFVFFGPYLQYFAGTMDLIANWIMENRGEEPGINEGDIFLHNDPWVGTPHQPDVALMAPVFHEGEIFCWVSNLMHQNDVGGTVAGSFCPNAQDVFWDPPLFPPMKIVDRGDIVEEKEAIYRRQSRTPQQLSMDLRAGIAGINSSRNRVTSLIDEYRAETVKGTMRQLIDSGERSFQDILADIPDGTWRERVYQERAITGDDGVYRLELTLRKEGDQLYFDNSGTEDQVGAINQPFAGWRGSIIAMVNLLLQPERMGATGGMMRSLNFEPEPGTITCPEYGAAVSAAGIYGNEVACSMANSVISKMLLCANDKGLREKAMGTTQAQWQLSIGEGTNQRGDYYVAPMLDGVIGSTGPTPTKDGDFADGHVWIPEGQGPNVEAYERDWPILYLYRGEHQDTAGAGKRRSGNGGRLAYTLHGGTMALGVYTAEGIPKTSGILGGYPGSRGETRAIHNSNVNKQFADGDLPTDIQNLDGEEELTVGKGAPLELDDDSVVEWWWGSCAGYGDPITREPELVADDVRNGMVSKNHAVETYGVIVDDTGTVDKVATDQRRQEIRRERLKSSTTVDELDLNEGGD